MAAGGIEAPVAAGSIEAPVAVGHTETPILYFLITVNITCRGGALGDLKLIYKAKVLTF